MSYSRFSLFLAIAFLAAPLAPAADDSMDAKFQSLQDAVAQKKVPDVKKLAMELTPLVQDALCETAPQGEDERAAWKTRLDHAKAVGLYAEYALYAMAVESPAPTLIDLVATLETANPKSQYLDRAYGPYLVALSQTGAAAKVPAVAEKALVNFPENEDLLIVLADNAVTKKQPDRALTYSNRLVASLQKHKAPEGVPAAQWERKRAAGLGRGYWISGVIYAERGNYANCDRNLRAALPLIQENKPMLGPALFYLGMANYQLGKMTLNKALIQEAAKFSQQSALIESPYAEQARHNALVMKQEADRMR
jgi:hypothetical protein